MFSSNPSTSDVPRPVYDFEENAHKWKNVFVSSLEKILISVHPTLNAKEDALQYMESLVLRVLAMVCAHPPPHSVTDVEDRVLKVFPNPINRRAIGDAQAAVEKSKKKNSLMLPSDKVHPLLKDALQCKIDFQVTIYTLAVLESVSNDIVQLVGNYVKTFNCQEVTQRDVSTAMCADNVLMDMLSTHSSTNGEPLKASSIEELPFKCEATPLTYEQLVKDLIEHEKAFLRELNMISKVFRDKLLQIPAVHEYHRSEIDEIFSNIDEIYDFSNNVLGSLEDTVEVTKEKEFPAIGSCFEELAEGQEFHVYLHYCSEVVPSDHSQEAIAELVRHPEVHEALNNTSYGEGFRDAVLYYLPRLLHTPIIHVFIYHKYIKELILAASKDDEVSKNPSYRENLEQVEGLLCPLFSQLDRQLSSSDTPSHLKRRLNTEVNMRSSGQMRRQAVLKLNEIQRSIEGWEGKDITQLCNNLVLEGDLKQSYPGTKKQSDRHVFLFDGVIVLCKQKVGGYRFKEKHSMKNVEVRDREDCDDSKNTFEIQVHGQLGTAITFITKSLEEKNNWMSALVMITRRGMLERALDNILAEEEQQHPLRLPNASRYPFSIPDSDDNIVIEERENAATPLIKAGSLIKLVERLTYHTYADPMFVRTFLITYRSFCTPAELLELLKKRFNIPELDCCGSIEADGETVENGEVDGNCSLLLHREGVKRFKKQFSQPVQFRVLNIVRHWVDFHFYDFERDSLLLEELNEFLDSVQGKSMKRWAESICKIINRKRNEESREITFSQNRTPPSPKIHMRLDDKDWETLLPPCMGGAPPDGDLAKLLLMLHPIEVARQITLYEFDLYKSVKASELVGNAWTKPDKEEKSPNLLKMIHNTNKVTQWIMRCIVDCDNFEERVAVMTRVVEIMIMLYDLNNFSGLFEMTSALDSASVHRLEFTKAEVKKRLIPTQRLAYEEAMDLTKDHYKKYLEKLRSINPPCVPFFGIYLTNIVHIDVGNTDFVDPHKLINFNKRQKFAEIISEIQQYQNQAYCLQLDTQIRNFLETLSPFDGMSEADINNYLYNTSVEIEPKNIKKPLVRERKWPNLPLKSPGIKPRSSRIIPNPINHILSRDRESNSAEVSAGESVASLPHSPSAPHSPSTVSMAPSESFATFVPNSHLGSISHLSSSGSFSHTLPASFRQERPIPEQEDMVFSEVKIGSGAIISSGRPSVSSLTGENIVSIPWSVSSLSMTPGPFLGGITGIHKIVPPPLPPRSTAEAVRRTDPPAVDIPKPAQRQQAPDAPRLPPRDRSPPPVPPRPIHSNTLPHKHSAPLPASQLRPLTPGPPSQSSQFSYHNNAKHFVFNVPPKVSHIPPPLPPYPPQSNEGDLGGRRRISSVDALSAAPFCRRHNNGSQSSNRSSITESTSPPAPPPRLPSTSTRPQPPLPNSPSYS